MAVGALFGGSLFGWIIAGAALYYAFSSTGVNITQPNFDQFSDPGVGGGPWQAPTTSGTTVPLVFGTSRYPFPIIHHRLDGDNFANMWIVAAVGEDWNTLSAGEYENQLSKLWINDYEIENLTNYTEDEDLKDKDHSWYKFFPSGLGAYIEWDSTGKHALVAEAEVGESAESYALICTHNADVGAGPVHLDIRIMHQWEENGSNQTWRVVLEYLETVEGAQEYVLESKTQFFDATQTVDAGKDSETYHVAGTEATTVGFDMPYRGKFKITLYNDAASNEGSIYLDSIDITDPGEAYEEVNSNGTSLVLIRIIDNTGELARPSITGLITGGPSNPAEALQWTLTNTELGASYDTEHLDLGAFMEAADECDVWGYTFNRAYCSASTFEAAIQDMCMAGRLNLCDWNGLVTVFMDNEIPHLELPEVWLESSVESGSIATGKSARKDIPNSFNIKYVDAEIEYTAQDLLTENAELITETGAVNRQTIALTGVTNMSKAWEVGWYHMQYAMADKYLEFEPIPMLWKIQPGQPFIARTASDPTLENTEWVVLAIDESDRGKYRCRCIPYPREAWSPPELQEWSPDVYIPAPTPTPDLDIPNVSPGRLVINYTVTASSTEGHVNVNFTVNNVPYGTSRIKVYRSYTGYLDPSGDLSGYEAVGDIRNPSISSDNAFNTLEVIRYVEVRYRFTVVGTDGKESPLESAKLVVVFPYMDTENLPGYGMSEYGLAPYGG